MYKCKLCNAQLPHLKLHRTWKEKYITHRRKDKFKCEECEQITFVEVK